MTFGSETRFMFRPRFLISVTELHMDFPRREESRYYTCIDSMLFGDNGGVN